MSTSAAITPAAAAIAISAPAPSCGKKISKALTVAGGILATVVALAEGSRFLDLSANIFEHLPSMETNLVIGVAGITTMIAGHVLGGVADRKQKVEKAKIDQQIKAAEEEVATLKAERRTVIKKLFTETIEGFQAARTKLMEVHRHPQTKADRDQKKNEAMDQFSVIDRQLRERAASAYSVTIISDADTKLNSLLEKAERLVVGISKDEKCLDEIDNRLLSLIYSLPSAVDSLINARLNFLDERAKGQTSDDLEKKFVEIMSKVDTTSVEKPLVASIKKILQIVNEFEAAKTRVYAKYCQESLDRALDKVKKIQEHPQSRADHENRQREKDDPLARQITEGLKVHHGLTSGPIFLRRMLS